MRALHIKLLRDLRRLWAQALAIALVMAAGVATLIIAVGAHDSLLQTRTSYYEANGFADIFANVTRAPKALVPEIAAIDGVAAVEPRVVKIALTDVEGMAEPGSVQLVSLPDLHLSTLNRLYLRSGSLPDPGAANEAVVSEGFAKAHGFRQGSTFEILINGARREVRITGLALSPEFIYTIGPGDLMPDERRFGIVWMSETALGAAYNLTGAFSNVIVKLVPGASQPRVIEAIDRILEPYGGQGAYGRKYQLSFAFLDAELQQLQAMTLVLPPIFMLVAAYLVNMTLSRLVALEREEIGLLKALGYSSWAIARHYIEFVSLIALIGVVIGFAVGTWLGNEVTALYAKSYSFPFLVFSRNPALYAIAALVTLAAAIAGAIKAVRDVAWLSPAVAMSAPPPPTYKRGLSEILSAAVRLRQSTVMVSRHLLRWPWRTAGGVLGVALAVSILVGSLWSFGSIDYMIDYTFHLSDRQDASINFVGPKPLEALFAAQRLPGVIKAEPYRAIAVKMGFGHIDRHVTIMGRPQDADLTRVLDASLQPVALPAAGVVLSKALADILGARTGDEVTVELLEGDRRTLRVPVSAVIGGYLGLTAYMEIGALNRLLGEGTMISGVNVAIDPLRQDQLFATLKATPSSSFIALLKVALQRFRATLAQNVTTQISIYLSFAAIIAFGVVYNFARISLSEQGREMASLRVLGFTKGEVSSLLLTELAVVVIVAQPLGWLIGYGFALAMVNGFSTEIYRVPFVIGRDVYAYSSIVVVAAAVASGLIVRRRVDRLDMIAVLKTRE